MNQIQANRIMKNSIECKEHAVETITGFFHIYHAVEAREELRRLATIVKNGNSRKQGNEEEDIIYFCEKLEELIEAASFLAKLANNSGSGVFPANKNGGD